MTLTKDVPHHDRLAAQLAGSDDGIGVPLAEAILESRGGQGMVIQQGLCGVDELLILSRIEEEDRARLRVLLADVILTLGLRLRVRLIVGSHPYTVSVGVGQPDDNPHVPHPVATLGCKTPGRNPGN